MKKAVVRYLASACLLAACPAGMAIAQTDDPIAALSAEHQAFLSNTETLAMFGLTEEKVRTALTGRTPEAAAAYVDVLILAIEDSKFKAGRDIAEIALNPQARSWNAGQVVRPAFLDKMQRDPGPFSLKNYMFQRAGVATFADAPVALRKDDLVAGKVEVAFVGVPLDNSSGWRDAKRGPSMLRNMEGLVGPDADSGIDPGVVLSLADYGNLSVDQMAPERGMDHVREMIAEMAQVGVKPFIIGGDHTISYPNVAAMVDVYGAGNVALVQFDANANARLHGDHFLSDNQTLSRLMQNNIIPGSAVTHVGMRGRDGDPATKKWLEDAGVKIMPTSDVIERGWQAVTADILARLESGPQNVFVSFDMSVLDPGDAPAAGRPVPGGIHVREAIPMVREICSKSNVVGFDLLDPAPVLDLTYVSRLSANYILHACLSGIALRKQTAAAS